MMQPPMQGGQPPMQVGQPPMQGGGLDPNQAEDQVNQFLDANPEMTQQIHSALQQNGMQEQFGQIPPEEIQGMVQAFQQIASQPETYPEVYQQLMQAGGANPEDFPPPDSPPEVVQEFATKALLVIYYMGKLGQAAEQGGGQGGGQPPPGGGMAPPGGMVPQGSAPPVQGYPHGGVVGQGQQQQYPQGGQPHRQSIQNFANQVTLQQGSPNAIGGLQQQQQQQQQLLDLPKSIPSSQGYSGITSGIQYGQSGTLYQGTYLYPEMVKERDLMRQIYALSPGGIKLNSRGNPLVAAGGGGSMGTRRDSWGSSPVPGMPGAFYVGGGPGSTPGTFIKLPTGPIVQTPGAGARSPHDYIPDEGFMAHQAVPREPWNMFPTGPDQYYNIYGISTPGLETEPLWFGGKPYDAWQVNSKSNVTGGFTGGQGGPAGWDSQGMGGWSQVPVPYGYFDNKSQRLYPVRHEDQLKAYLGGDFSSGMPVWAGGNKGFANFGGAGSETFTALARYRDSQIAKNNKPYSWDDYKGPLPDPDNPVEYPKWGNAATFKSKPFKGFPHGGMIGEPNTPQNFGTGDDQLIAAKTGEGVLNVDAVEMIGGPTVVNQLNYQASGEIPGGRPVQGATGYPVGGMVGDERNNPNYGGSIFRSRQDDPNYSVKGAISGYPHGGMVGGKEAITSSGYVWSDGAQKYVEQSRNTKQFSGSTLQAMGFFGSFFGKVLGLVVITVAAVFTAGAALAALPLLQAAVTVAAGAAAGFLSTGTWQGALGGAVLGGLSAAGSAYLNGAFSGAATGANGAWGTGVSGSTGAYGGIGPEAIPTGGAANLNAAISGGFSPSAMQQQSIFGGAPAPGGGGVTLDPFASQTGGPLLSGGGGGGSTVVSGTGGPPNQPQQGGVVQDLLKGITDPRNILKTGVTLLGGQLGSEDYGSEAGLLASGANIVKQNQLLDLQTNQYKQNQIPLANQATGMARRFASPMAGGIASFNADKIRSARELEEQERRMLQRGQGSGGPGSAAFEANLRPLRNDQRLSSTNAFNKGINDRMALGTQALTGAAALSPAPDFGQASSSINAANSTYATTRQREVEAGNQYAQAFGDLVFPSDREDEQRRVQQVGLAHGGMVGRYY